jgi:nucleotide-binding universal stress UspA family protein
MFNRILVPTDLSAHAACAVRYSLRLAQRLPGAQIIFFFANHRPIPTSTPIRLYHELKADLLKQDLGALEEHVHKVLRQVQLAYDPDRMKLHVENGAYLDSLGRVLRLYKPDLVTMGNRGAGGLKKYLMGSNTVKTLSLVKCPVLAVPEGCTPTPAPHVLYATDLKQWEPEIEQVMGLASLLNARLTVVHLHRPDPSGAGEPTREEVHTRQLREALAYYPAELVLLPASDGQDLAKGLQQLASERKPALLVMFNRKKSWLESLFSDSHTQAVLYDARLPVLAFKE